MTLRLVEPQTSMTPARDPRAGALAGPERAAPSWRATLGGALGAMTVLADVAPGLAPAWDLALGVATAAVATAGVLAIARAEAPTVSPRFVFVESLRDQTVARGPTTAAAVLALAADVAACTQPSPAKIVGIGARAMWAGVRSLLSRPLAEHIPGLATLVRAACAGLSARRHMELVATVEGNARRVCQELSEAAPRFMVRPHLELIAAAG